MKGKKEMKKTYDVPQELLDIMIESQAMEELRDAFLKLPFRFKKAKKCAIARITLREEFWREIRALYPELKDKSLKLTDFQFLTIMEE